MLCLCPYEPSLTPAALGFLNICEHPGNVESLWPMWQNLTKGDVSWQINVPHFHPSSGWFGDTVHPVSLFRRFHRSSIQFYPIMASPILHLPLDPLLFLMALTLAPKIVFFNKPLMHQTFSQTLPLEFLRLRNYIRKNILKILSSHLHMMASFINDLNYRKLHYWGIDLWN